MQLLERMHLRMGKVSGRRSGLMVPATTAVGWDTKAVIAGKKEAERLDMC